MKKHKCNVAHINTIISLIAIAILVALLLFGGRYKSSKTSTAYLAIDGGLGNPYTQTGDCTPAQAAESCTELTGDYSEQKARCCLAKKCTYSGPWKVNGREFYLCQPRTREEIVSSPE